MALLGVLIATLIVILLIVFANPLFHSADKAPLEPKKIENNATDAVEKSLERSKLEQSQVQNIR